MNEFAIYTVGPEDSTSGFTEVHIRINREDFTIIPGVHPWATRALSEFNDDFEYALSENLKGNRDDETFG